MAKKRKQKYYVVWHGRKTGVFHSWEECSNQVTGFANPQYKSFDSIEAAQRAFSGTYKDFEGQNTATSWQERLITANPPVVPVMR